MRVVYVGICKLLNLRLHTGITFHLVVDRSSLVERVNE